MITLLSALSYALALLAVVSSTAVRQNPGGLDEGRLKNAATGTLIIFHLAFLLYVITRCIAIST